MREALSDLQRGVHSAVRKCPQVRAKKVEDGVTNAMLDEVTAIGNKVINLNRAVMRPDAPQ